MNIKFYFDYNATTPLDPRVLEAMSPFLGERFHNPSSFYRQAGEARAALDTAREKVARLINAHPDEIFFTGSGTESDNLAVLGSVRKAGEKDGRVVTSAIEHPAVLKCCEHLESGGVSVTYLSVDRVGRIDPGSLEEALDGSTRLVTLMTANNEIGTIQDIGRLAAIAHGRGALFHTDAVQAVGKIPVDVRALDVDLLSFSGHKIYGPKGVGVLYKKKGVKIDPLIFGGGHERGLRSGTENVPGIVGVGRAAELAAEEMVAEGAKLKPMRDRLQRGLLQRIPDILINGDTDARLVNTLNVSIRHIEGESILAMLDSEGFALSSGSACSSKSLEPSHVLLALGLTHEDAHGSLRFSLGRYNTDGDVSHLLEALPPVVERLRSMSPFWKKS